MIELPPPIGYINLYQAVDAVGRRMRGTDWTPICCQSWLNYQVGANLGAVENVIEAIAKACEAGTLAAAFQHLFKGVDELDRSVWRKLHWHNFFATGTTVVDQPRLLNSEPHPSGEMLPCERKIFVRRDSLDEFIKSLPSITTPGRRGRPAAADWDAFGLALRKQIEERGLPSEDNDYSDWRRQNHVEEWAADFLADRQEKVGESTIRARVSALLSQIEAGN